MRTKFVTWRIRKTYFFIDFGLKSAIEKYEGCFPVYLFLGAFIFFEGRKRVLRDGRVRFLYETLSWVYPYITTPAFLDF